MKIEVADVNSDVVFFPCHLPFVHVLVLLSFPCEALGLTLTADIEASPSSPLNSCLYSSLSLLSLWSSFPGTQAQRSPCPHTASPLLFLCVQPLLPHLQRLSHSCPTTVQLQLPYGSSSDLGFFLLLLPLPPASHPLFSPPQRVSLPSRSCQRSPRATSSLRSYASPLLSEQPAFSIARHSPLLLARVRARC